MDIRTFSDGLMAKMESELAKVDEQDALKSFTLKVATVKACILELKNFVLDYKFLNELDEIYFFKEIKPKFLSRFLFYSRVQHLQLLVIAGSCNRLDKCFEREIEEINEYLFNNRDFYIYLISQRSDLDRTYFLRGSRELRDVTLDDRFATPMDAIVSGIESRKMLKQYVQDRLKQPADNYDSTRSRLHWARSKTDLVELVYALHSSKVFGNNVGIKEIVSGFESLIACDLSQYSRVFLEIRQRKKVRTTFLDTLKENLLGRIEFTDR